MVDSLPLTVVAAIMFFVATIGINIVANFIPPAYDIANLMPSKIDFKLGGLITSGFALIIGGLWVSTISQLGIFGFVNTLGAVLAPIYGIMMVDYYMLKKGKLNVEQLFSASEDGEYYYDNGWNKKAMIAFVVPAIFSVATVWVGSLAFLSGFSWVIGAALGGLVYYAITKK
jgi:NCS1 family nucleobase:cation symporter-1